MVQLLSRYEALLSELHRYLEAELGRRVRLNEVKQLQVNAWLETLPEEQRTLAEKAVRDFEAYLVAWGWVEQSPLQAA